MIKRLLCISVASLGLMSQAIAAEPNAVGEQKVPEVNSTYTPPAVPNGGGCSCIDITFIIDTTGSMGGAIANVAAEIGNLLTLAQATCTDVQAALVTFTDQVTVVHDLNNDTAGVAAAISALVAGGGAGEPEASDDAIREVTTDATCFGGSIGDFSVENWRADCCKLAILVTDARPAGADCDDSYDGLGSDGADAHAAALAAAAAGVKVGAVFVPTFGDPGDIATIMQDYAATTGGIYGLANFDGTGTAAAMEQMILDCSGGASTELCCVSGTCVEVIAGQCRAIGGYVVSDCVECPPVSVEQTSWGKVKAAYTE